MLRGLFGLGMSFTVLVLTAAQARQSQLARAQEAGPAPAANAPDLAPFAARFPGVPDAVAEAMQDRDYDKAVAAIDAALSENKANADYLTYLKGHALELAARYDDALTVFQAFPQAFPKSAWLRRARFSEGICLMRKGDFKAAELIYREQAQYLLSGDRKQEIATIYLEFADKLFKPASTTQAPDYQKALEFYREALAVGATGAERSRVELQTARCQQLLGQFPEAAESYKAFAKAHPDDALTVEAIFRSGECLLAQGQPVEARRAWLDLLANYANGNSDYLAQAAFQVAITHGVPQPPTVEDLNLGVAALESYIQKFPDHALVPKAHLAIAQSNIFHGRHEAAVTALTRFLENAAFADKEEIPDARILLGQAYQAQKKFDAALAVWRDFLAKHPTHAGWSNVQRTIIDTEFLIGADARAGKNHADARRVWNEFLAKYPLDPRVPEILFQFGEMQFADKAHDEAIAEWRRLVSKYPGTEEASKAQYWVGLTLEEQLGKFEEAIEEYRKLNWGGYASSAQQRLNELTAKSLAVRTERVFRSNESPYLLTTTRNIGTLNISAYSVDLETYFRKMHLAQGVESLDVALIDPDHSLEFSVPEYTQYKKVEHPLPLEIKSQDGAGVWVVNVASNTMEATTLVIQSDLDILVKSSRDEVFVFAQNLRTGQAWPGVKLLISDGSTVFTEGVTGADGVFKGTFEQLKNPSDVRVFAVSDRHIASNVVNLDGIGIAQGLTDRGFIYSDRAAYRAGQLVHVRGVIRQVANDTYSVPEGKEYALLVYDPRGRLLYREDTRLNTYGSFHAHFFLPKSSVQGEYRMQVKDADGKSYEGGFVVQSFQLDPVQLSVETDRRVFYRGEEIKGQIVAKYYYGSPLADREIQYQWADGRLYTGRTNSEGKLDFTLPTRDFREASNLMLRVSLPERGLSFAQSFVLATTGFSVSVETSRNVALAGEPFEVNVTTSDAEGKPTAEELKVNIYEQTNVNGQIGERLITGKPLTTDDKGQGQVSLSLEKGGRYLVRAEGMDRFMNPVSGQMEMQISDDSDDVRLRILADKHTYRAGDSASIRVHWRDAPRLAVITYQGARILEYKLVELKTGDNVLDIPMTANLAPNFDLAVTVMTPFQMEGETKLLPRLHEATSPFTVGRELRISVEHRRKEGQTGPLRPGEEVELQVTTTDPQGKPVAAEVSLGMIEEALRARFPRREGRIDDFFRGATRQSAMRTTSSVNFSYNPPTQNINGRLLAERDRLEIAEVEAERLRAMAESANAVDFADVSRWSSTHASMEAEFDQPVAAGSGGELAGGYGMDPSGHPGGPAPPPGSPEALYAKRSIMLGAIAGKPGSGIEQLSDETLSRGTQFRELSDTAGTTQLGRDWAYFGRPSIASGNSESLLGDLLAIQGGVQVNFGDFDQADRIELFEKMAAQGAIFLANEQQHETGYWNPVVVTDANGLATVTFAIPERTTRWTVEARGITQETLAGETTLDLIAKKDLFAEVKLPQAFTAGDQAQVGVTVTNDALDSGEIVTTLEIRQGDKTAIEKKTIKVTAKGQTDLYFPVNVAKNDAMTGDAQSLSVVVTVQAGEFKDTLHRSVEVVPHGVPVFATAGGSASGDASALVEAAADMPMSAPTLKIYVGPSVERSLIDAVLGGPVMGHRIAVANGLESGSSDLMAAVALQKLLGRTLESDTPLAASLAERVRGGVSLLVSSQSDDGGWSWTGLAGTSDPFVTSRSMWALALAKQAGYAVPAEAMAAGVNFLKTKLVETRDTDLETRCVLLHGLTMAGEEDFALANRLHRSRQSLSGPALAHLALTFAEMNRNPAAQELLALIAQRDLDKTVTRGPNETFVLPWCHSPVELRALYALALQRVTPQAPAAKELVEWLLAHRVGLRWNPDKVTGPAILAISEWYASAKFEQTHYQLTVFVNNAEVAKLDMDKAAVTHTVEVPGKFLKPGEKQRVNFVMTGRGQYTYQCVMEGFVPAEKVASTHKEYRVTRIYEPAPLEYKGEVVSRGFGPVAGSYTTFRNPLTQLPVGRKGHVELYISRNYVDSRLSGSADYLVVTEPLPAGVSVVEDSVRGPFDRYEIVPGAIVFYVGSRYDLGSLEFDIIGRLPGKYQAGPTVVRDAFRPDRMAVAAARDLEMLPLGEKSNDAYRLTPAELYELGRREFADHDYANAGSHLTDLITNWNLQPDFYKETARMLLDVHLETGPADAVVKYFEIIKERYPELELPFDKIMQVAAAYDEIGEYERSYLVFRTITEASFVRESKVAGFLADQGEFVRSVAVMSRLLREYPGEPYNAAASFALSQTVYAKAPQASADTKLRDARLTRIDLVRAAHHMVRGFLTEHPDDPASDQAALSSAAALLDMELFAQAMDACQRYATRYSSSQLLDSYWYIVGYCHYALGEHEKAMEMCRKVADHRHVDAASGREADSANKWQAIYILGQVYHSLGEAAQAINEYRRVQDRFPDALEAISYFTRQQIELPEVTWIKPGEKAALDLKFRNVAACDVRVYRIDLMKFGLLKRDLSGITSINLAGIKPLFESNITLGDGNDYRDRTHVLDLPLESEGAYLVVTRGANLHASGLVVVSPLEVEVNEDAQSGRVRATVKNTSTDKYVPNVHVKVIGSRNQDFTAGKTDLRGVFIADAIQGTTTIIATTQDDQYAFYRGKVDLGPPPPPAEHAPESSAGMPALMPMDKGGLLDVIQLQNSTIQSTNCDSLNQLYDCPTEGVQVEKAY